jgi:hypothetical protein
VVSILIVIHNKFDSKLVGYVTLFFNNCLFVYQES